VRERFSAVRVVEQENRGLGAGLNAGMRAGPARYHLLINSDAWLVGDALARLVAFADAHEDAAVVAPRLRNPDGTLQRSVRGFPTLWRVATEYFFLRRLAPHSHAFNAYYAGDFDHASARPVEWVMGSCFLVRRAAVDQIGMLDEDFFLFSEETDWLYRFHRAGWKVWFTPDAEAVHVGGATHGGRMYVENVRGILRWFAKHRGPSEAARARDLLAVALRLRGLVFRGERGRMYRDAARAL
jgi:GT2 family glycosyltransferase